RLTAAPWPKQVLNTALGLRYRGTIASDGIGPVALNQVDDEEAWALTWGQKKVLFRKKPTLLLRGGARRSGGRWPRREYG
ncbi:MAG: hypothetical protein ACKPKO_04125, partial [Candidatus Fonsibacter sp.]